MKTYIERENKHLELEAKDGIELLSKLNISSSTVILVRDDEVILPETKLNDSDLVSILSVISGG